MAIASKFDSFFYLLENTDVLGAITNELNEIAKYHDQIEVIEKYLKKEASTYEPSYHT